MQKGQASMEYLVLLAALLFFFSMMLPLLQKSYALSFFVVDTTNAKRFASELQLKANEISFLSNGSMLALKARPVESWLLKAEGTTLLIKVKSDSLRAEKVFAVEFQQEIVFPETVLEKETIFLLRKENNTVLLENPH